MECEKCNTPIHTKCHKKASFINILDNWYCQPCFQDIEPKYNPFASWKGTELDKHYDDDCDNTALHISSLLNSCKSYSIKDFNSLSNSTQSSCKSLSTLFLNIDGNHTNFDQFTTELTKLSHNFLAIGLAETNTDREISGPYQIPSYNSYYQNTREGKFSGTGVALYVHEAINVSVIEEVSECSQHIECIFVQTKNTSKPLVIGVVYRPNDGDRELFLEKLESIYEFLPKTGVYVMGDYNINLIAKNVNTEYEDCFLSAGYFPLISTYTHHRPGTSKSCIDNIFTNDPDHVTVSGTLSDCLSHHLAIFQFSDIPIGKNNLNPQQRHTQYYDYSNAHLNAFVRDLKEIMPKLTPSENFVEFTDAYNKTLDHHCKLDKPKITKRTPINNPWITDSIRNAIDRKYEFRAEWTATISKHCPDGDQNLYNNFSNYRRILKHIITNAKSSYKCSQIEENKEDRKKVWSIINELRGKQRNRIKPSFIINNEKIIERRAIANAFNEYFVSIALKLNETIEDNTLVNMKIKSFAEFLNPPTMNSIFMTDCTEAEILGIISNLESNKASDIPVRIIKKSAHVISKALALYYNKLMENGTFPENLKLGKITPIYKKENCELIENYRPISTLPIFGKIFEKVIYIRMYSFLTSQNILYSNQYGFRPSHSTSHALNYSISLIESAIAEKKHMLGIFIDLSKAFDTIDHPTLLQKLNHYGIRGNAHSLLKSYLSGREQYTDVLGSQSDKQPVKFGVPQGSVLGPLLFLLYINDIVNSSNLGDFVLFADDTNIFVQGMDETEVYDRANKLLENLQKYMLLNKLHINMSKCCYIHFKPKKKIKGNGTSCSADREQNTLKLKIGVTNIKKVTETRFLGVTIDENLTWDAHIKNLNRKLNYAIAILSRISKDLPKHLYKDLYYTLFESHLSYCISVWGGIPGEKMGKIHKIQKKCIRVMFGDREAFTDKFKTCARTRLFENQILGQSFYKKENTKPLFEEHGILTVQNLYNYHCFMETFKILKFRTPMSIYSLYKIPKRSSNNLLTPNPSIQNIYKSSVSWNTLRPKINLRLYDMSTKLNCIKTTLKKILHENQHRHHPLEWLPEFDFNIKLVEKVVVQEDGSG